MNKHILTVLGIIAFVVPQLARQAGAQRGTIEGVVLRAGTSEPIPNVGITLSGGANAGISVEQAKVLVDNILSRGVAPPSDILQTALEGTPNFFFQPAATGGTSPFSQPITSTDREGRFTIRDLTPGPYAVRAQLEGYFGPLSNVGVAPNVIAHVTVAASEAAKVALELTPSSVISGQVLDAKGQPVVNGSIEALRISYANGVKGLSAPIAGPRGRGNVTNDRGEYRLFGLPPGDYYLASSPPAPGSRGGDTSPDRREVLVRTFYPATINIAEAQIVTLRGGQDLTGMHIRRQMAPVITISGQVINDLPKATEVTARRGAGDATVARIQIVPSNKNAIVDPSVSMFANAALTAPNSGRFEYRGALAPGTYDLFADIDDPMGYGPAPSPQKRSYGRARVTLDGGDLRGITIAVRRGVEVKGRVTLEGKAEGTAGMQVMLQPDDNSTRISVLSSTGRNQHAIAPDGSFAIPFVPSARYRFQLGTIRGTSDPLVFTPLTDSYIADVLENGVSIYESGLSVGDQPPGRIEIRLKRDGGSIEGSVTDADGKPVLGATVILAPASQRREIVALYKSATSVRSGRFVISNIAPGDYRLLALQALESRAYEVPEFLDRYDDRAQRITVAGGGRLQAQLRIIPSTR